MRTYKAYVMQSGTSDPTVHVFENVGFTTPPQFVRLADGQYQIQATGMFNGPTFIQIGNYRTETQDAYSWRINSGRIDDDVCSMYQDAYVVDEVLTADGFVCAIEITVY